MSQIYEITGLFGVIFVILTSTASAVYLWHNILLPAFFKIFFKKYYAKHYSNNSLETNSIKKFSFFKKWFK
jgi:hypothetical protein